MNDRAASLRALELYEELLELTPDEQRAARERLAREEPAASVILERLCAVDVEAWSTGVRVGHDAPVPPQRLGAYRLQERIGRGGMGDVYRAVREDGLFDQTVAIKIMRASLDPDGGSERFAQERRILGRLAHADIARILDGGSTPDGRPYLVMDYIEGVPLDAYARDRLPALGELIRICAAACRAVQRAHQALIAHADLKPSNILVDATGGIHLLDFGISSLIAEHHAEGPVIRPEVPVTPAFASPERLAGAMPSAADDVYALGVTLSVVLYGWDEKHRLHGRGPEVGARIAWARETERLPRDLRAIVARATAASPDSRYPTAGDLADDLERWVDGFAVRAMGADRRYGAGRFIRRHRLAITSTAAAILIILGGLVGTSLMYVRAEQARAEAEHRYADVNSLSHFLQADVYDALRQIPGTLRLREQVADRGQRYLERLAASPNAPPAVRLDAVRGYERLSAVRADAQSSNLGDRSRALEDLAHAREIAEQLLASGTESEAARIELARVLLEMERVRSLSKGPGEPERALIAEARDVLDGTTSATRATPGWGLVNADWWATAAMMHNWSNDYAGGIAAADRATQELAKVPPAPQMQREMARIEMRALDTRAEAIYYDRGAAAAVAEYEHLLMTAEHSALRDPEDPDARGRVRSARYGLGTTLLSAGRAAECIDVLRPALADIHAQIAQEPGDFNAIRQDSVFQGALAQALMAVGRRAESLVAGEQLLADRARFLASRKEDYLAQRDYLTALVILGDLYGTAGQGSVGCARFREARDFINRNSGTHPANAFDTSTNVAAADEGIRKTCKP